VVEYGRVLAEKLDAAPRKFLRVLDYAGLGAFVREVVAQAALLGEE
jgi:hypothetical protein